MRENALMLAGISSFILLGIVAALLIYVPGLSPFSIGAGCEVREFVFKDINVSIESCPKFGATNYDICETWFSDFTNTEDYIKGSASYKNNGRGCSSGKHNMAHTLTFDIPNIKDVETIKILGNIRGRSVYEGHDDSAVIISTNAGGVQIVSSRTGGTPYSQDVSVTDILLTKSSVGWVWSDLEGHSGSVTTLSNKIFLRTELVGAVRNAGSNFGYTINDIIVTYKPVIVEPEILPSDPDVDDSGANIYIILGVIGLIVIILATLIMVFEGKKKRR